MQAAEGMQFCLWRHRRVIGSLFIIVLGWSILQRVCLAHGAFVNRSTFTLQRYFQKELQSHSISQLMPPKTFHLVLQLVGAMELPVWPSSKIVPSTLFPQEHYNFGFSTPVIGATSRSPIMLFFFKILMTPD
jgi:hypothetical protein